jgi:hypothetical protein
MKQLLISWRETKSQRSSGVVEEISLTQKNNKNLCFSILKGLINAKKNLRKQE